MSDDKNAPYAIDTDLERASPEIIRNFERRNGLLEGGLCALNEEYKRLAKTPAIYRKYDTIITILSVMIVIGCAIAILMHISFLMPILIAVVVACSGFGKVQKMESQSQGHTEKLMRFRDVIDYFCDTKVVSFVTPDIVTERLVSLAHWKLCTEGALERIGKIDASKIPKVKIAIQNLERISLALECCKASASDLGIKISDQSLFDQAKARLKENDIEREMSRGLIGATGPVPKK
jgi:hypothetical protein